MVSTTNFQEWFDMGHAPETFGEAYCLARAVAGESMGSYQVTDAGGRRFIKEGDDTLVLVSQPAKNAFAKAIEQFNPDPDLGWEGMYAYRSAMSRDD
ncbi:hypothetical protein [Methylocystis iwaonis]|uniref:hypothetical protein n=1 Tax=Methylocystis iwaonis TaxID=2885079 RepID=UPI002E7BBADB|nr:hypothetical protein [Methylocystis iwaonis]